MIVTIVLFIYFGAYIQIFSSWKFVENHTENEYFRKQLYQFILVQSSKCSTVEDLQKITLEVNDYNHGFVHFFWSLVRNVRLLEIHRQSH
jgi:hypothetical protein